MASLEEAVAPFARLHGCDPLNPPTPELTVDELNRECLPPDLATCVYLTLDGSYWRVDSFGSLTYYEWPHVSGETALKNRENYWRSRKFLLRGEVKQLIENIRAAHDAGRTDLVENLKMTLKLASQAFRRCCRSLKAVRPALPPVVEYRDHAKDAELATLNAEIAGILSADK